MTTTNSVSSSSLTGGVVQESGEGDALDRGGRVAVRGDETGEGLFLVAGVVVGDPNVSST